MLGFANIYSIYLSVYQLLICYFLLKPRDIIITKFDEEPLHFPEITVFLFPVYSSLPSCEPVPPDDPYQHNKEQSPSRLISN